MALGVLFGALSLMDRLFIVIDAHVIDCSEENKCVKEGMWKAKR